MDAIEFFNLQGEIANCEVEMNHYRRLGNGFGYKQAKAHLRKLRGKERRMRWN